MKVYAAPEEIAVPTFGYGDDGIARYQRECDEYLASVQAWARSSGEPHALAGEVVRTPYADGHAEYVIAKINGRVCLIHIGTWDGWRNDMFEDTATVAYLRKVVARNKSRAALVSH